MQNILVVESDSAVRSLMRELLSDEGYRVQVLSEPSLCPAQLGAPGLPDLLMLEITPATADRTLGILRQLRHQPATAALPVLLSTTDEPFLAQLAPELRRLECAALLKPFDLDGCLQRVREQLARPAAGPSAGPSQGPVGRGTFG